MTSDAEQAFESDPLVKARKKPNYMVQCVEQQHHLYVTASYRGREIGRFSFICEPHNRLNLENALIPSEEHRRKGLGTLMVLRAKHEKPGYKITAIKHFIDEQGRNFWEKLKRLGIVED